MAFYDVVVLYEDAFEESKGGQDRGTFTIKRTLLAKSNTPNPSFVTIGNSTTAWPGLGGEPIDQLNSLRNFDGILARCSSRRFGWYDGTESGVKIDLTYEGLSSYQNTDSGGSEQPRTLETVTWRRLSISTSQISVPATDEKGQGFCNSAGDPVDGLEEETALATLKYTNEFNPNPALHRIFYWMNRCNDRTYLGAAEYTLRVTGFSAEFDDKSMLWKVALELTYNPKTWEISYYDAGYNEIADIGGGVLRKRAILDDRGNPVTSPVPLDGQGAAKAAEVPDDGNPNFRVVPGLVTLRGEPYATGNFDSMLADLRMY